MSQLLRQYKRSSQNGISNGRKGFLGLCSFSFLAILLTPLAAHAGSIKVATISGHGGYVETAHFCSFYGKSYVGGWIRPHFWSNRRIYVQVDVKNAEGKVIATQTGYAYPTGRPQVIAQFGVAYVVSFKEAELSDGSEIEVRYVN